MPQRSTVSAAFTVREVVELGRFALPPSRRRVDQALADLDLQEGADRPYPALSVGQQQRVTLARAVAQLASDGHLVLDEPTSAMDLRHVRDTMKLLRRLADGGATVLVALHDRARDVLGLERLHEVFGVGFEWISRPGTEPILYAHT